jgi:hypothetical protein
LRSEVFGLVLHLLDEARSVDAWDTGVIFYSVGVVYLAAGQEFLEDERFESIAGRIERRGETGGTCSDNDAIIFFSHKDVLY